MPLTEHHRIIIVGAGIVGTTLAWYLSRAFSGKIILIDSQEVGLGVTQHAFAWLNASYGARMVMASCVSRRLKSGDAWIR